MIDFIDIIIYNKLFFFMSFSPHFVINYGIPQHIHLGRGSKDGRPLLDFGESSKQTLHLE